MTVKLAEKIGMKKKEYLARIDDTIRLAVEMRMKIRRGAIYWTYV
jgi:hypothetical protein